MDCRFKLFPPGKKMCWKDVRLLVITRHLVSQFTARQQYENALGGHSTVKYFFAIYFIDDRVGFFSS
jgi:hypothetical protein